MVTEASAAELRDRKRRREWRFTFRFMRYSLSHQQPSSTAFLVTEPNDIRSILEKVGDGFLEGFDGERLSEKVHSFAQGNDGLQLGGGITADEQHRQTRF